MRGPFAALLAALCGPIATAQEPRASDPPPATATAEGRAADERPADEAALFRRFAELRGLEASYTEEKHLTLLAVPLKSRGRLFFLAADGERGARLTRVVETPEKATLTIGERELRMASKDGVEVLDLRQSDRVQLFVTSLLRVFQGDRKALAAHYRVRYALSADDDAGWLLELTPRGEPLDQILKSLTLHGRGRAVTRIELVEPNGDRTVTAIVAVDPQRTFSPAEQKELFGVEPQARGPGGERR